MKMTRNSFVRRAVLLLTFSFLITLIAATAILAGNGDPAMTVIFNNTECRVTLTYPGLDEEIEMTSGEPVDVPYGKAVTVTVKPLLGYQLSDIVDADNPANSIMSLYAPTYYNQNFLNSVRAEVTCSTRVFDVKFEQADITNLPYTFPEIGNPADLATLKYHYMQFGSLTYLPVVARTGYTFDHWSVIKSDGTEVQKITTKTENGVYYIPHEIINQDMVDTGTIYLHAEFTPDPQPLVRYDYVYDLSLNERIHLLGSYNSDEKWQALMDMEVSGLTQMGDDGSGDDPANPYANYKSYPGYKLLTDMRKYSIESITKPTAQNPNPNIFYRLYLPIVYTLSYENLADGVLPEGAPQTYTYDSDIDILNPTRRGYKFLGWKVTIDGEVVDENTGDKFSLGTLDAAGNAKYAAKDEKIVLTAIWQAEEYDITYDWDVTDPALKAELDALNASLPKSFVFDAEDLAINDPIRYGYKFLGWVLHYTNGEGQPATEDLTSTDGKYLLNCNTYAQSITLTARWEAETYTVTLDGQGADNAFTTAIPGVQYDAVWTISESFQVPTRVGYTFDGYWSAPNGGGEQYIDKDGNVVDKKEKWDLDGENGSVTLYAKWIINKYSITINTIEKIPAGKEHELSIEIYVNNSPITYKGEPILLDYQTVFYVKIGMPSGYEIVSWNVESFTQNGNVFTTGNITLGAENITMTIQARPSAPVLGGDVKSIRPVSDTEIKVLFADATIATLYEVAISLDSDVTNLAADAWKSIADGQDHYVFGDLQPGTNYYVFVRLKETNDTLSGIAFWQKTLTEYDEYVEEMVDRLNGMITNGDGDIAKGVIANTIKEIDKLREDPDAIPENFYQLVQDLIDGVEEKLIFARLQDSKIAALQTHREECMASGSFSPENKALLNSLCANAVSDISGATTEEDVEAIYNTAKAAMEAVPVTYLYDANGFMQLTSQLGLAQNSGITLSSIEDIKALRRAVADAIAKGLITADSFITIEEATELLRTLDTVSAYSFNLINVQASEGDAFTFKLTIPEALAGRTGLQVAYFNQATGTLELLKTTVAGNTLIFSAKQVSDFVILADPTVDLTAVIIALSAILLCQLIAIALVLVSCNKAKNAVQHASVALPIFLTIHFLPVANAELIALGLGIAVILAQIVLMWLLLSSGMIRVFKTKKTAPTQQEVTAVVREEDLQEDPTAVFDEEDEPVEEEPVEEEPAEEGLDDEAFDEELAEELAHEQEEELADDEQVAEEELPEEAEEVYDDEEFIEHAPNPYYSLDDEENEYAFDEEEAERVSDVDTTDQEAEETPQGRDPLDGVFGAADVQDGDAGDEGGSPRDAYAYGESYEYGDEADASYAEAEDADREETEGQGTVDPYAYVVEDDGEEISDDEEMYRYDE